MLQAWRLERLLTRVARQGPPFSYFGMPEEPDERVFSRVLGELNIEVHILPAIGELFQ